MLSCAFGLKHFFVCWLSDGRGLIEAIGFTQSVWFVALLSHTHTHSLLSFSVLQNKCYQYFPIGGEGGNDTLEFGDYRIELEMYEEGSSYKLSHLSLTNTEVCGSCCDLANIATAKRRLFFSSVFRSGFVLICP